MNRFATFRDDPFFVGADLPQALALEHQYPFDDRRRHQVNRRGENNTRDIDLFANPFSFMQTMMNNMGQMMSQMETRMNSNDFNGENGNGVSFSSSTVMTMDNRNGGQPKIFQATSERLRGPQGFERTRKALRDTTRNVEKMEVAHRLGERGHRITKERDPHSGQYIENREFQHIEDENAFEHEWYNQAEKYGLKTSNRLGFSSQANNLLMTPPTHNYRRSQSQEPRQLAIEHAPSSSRNSRHQERRNIQNSNL